MNPCVFLIILHLITKYCKDLHIVKILFFQNSPHQCPGVWEQALLTWVARVRVLAVQLTATMTLGRSYLVCASVASPVTVGLITISSIGDCCKYYTRMNVKMSECCLAQSSCSISILYAYSHTCMGVYLILLFFL